MWKQLLSEHKGASIGLAIGIILGIIYLFAGLWKTLVFGFIAFCCFWIGHRIDRGQSWINLEPVANWLSKRWNLFR